MSTEGQRLREQMRAVGQAKAASRAEDVEAHLALPLGERLERAVRLSDAMTALSAANGRAGTLPPDEEALAWRRVYEHLHHIDANG